MSSVAKPAVPSLPDVQQHGSPAATLPIMKVGIRGLTTTLRLEKMNGGMLEVPADVSCYVSLKDRNKKGINMSRIPRTLMEYRKENANTPSVILAVLEDLRKNLESNDAYVKFRFRYPIKVAALRSGIETDKYYTCTLEARVADEIVKFYLTVEVNYSSTCPCSAALSDHLKEGGAAGIAHSQRSVAKITINFDPGNIVYIEELVSLAEDTLKTPTQMICKREDEQEFARLSHENQKFVEDSVRMLSDALNSWARIIDYVIVCEHHESLHDFDAVAVSCKGIVGGLK